MTRSEPRASRELYRRRHGGMPAAQYTMHPAKERTRWEVCLVGHDAPDAFRGVRGGCPCRETRGTGRGGAWVTTLAGGASTAPPTGAICCSFTLRASRRSLRDGWKASVRSPSSAWSRSPRAASTRRGVRRLDIGHRWGWDKPPLSAGVFQPCASGHWETRGRSVTLLQIPPCSPLVRDRVRAPAVGAPCSQDAIAYQIAEQLACP